MVDLIFSDDESSITLEETVTSTALVTFTHDGKDYQMMVPVTIDIDETIPLTDSSSVTPSASRVGSFAVEVVGQIERSDEITISYSTYAPTDDNHKLVFVGVDVTNLSSRTRDFASWRSAGRVVGVDAVGRSYEVEWLFDCDDINPGSTSRCVALFDIRQDITLTKIAFQVLDEGTFTLPEPTENEEE